jgi:hypothetical protein
VRGAEIRIRLTDRLGWQAYCLETEGVAFGKDPVEAIERFVAAMRSRGIDVPEIDKPATDMRERRRRPAMKGETKRHGLKAIRGTDGITVEEDADDGETGGSCV